MQASSITEALLMSPRSMSSTTTKPVTPATPVPPGPLAPLTRPSHHSPPSPFPLSPLSPGSSTSPAESARHDAHVRSLASNDSTLSCAGHSNSPDARMGAEQVQSGERVADIQYTVRLDTLHTRSSCLSAFLHPMPECLMPLIALLLHSFCLLASVVHRGPDTPICTELATCMV